MNFCFARPSVGTPKVEIRIEVPEDEVSILDGYCSATANNRTDVIRLLLREWSASKRREATVICRVAGINPTAPDRCRISAGE